MNTEKLNDLIPLSFAAEKIGISREYARQLCIKGAMKHHIIGKMYFVPRGEVLNVAKLYSSTGSIISRKKDVDSFT